jgi:hypothetical protein
MPGGQRKTAGINGIQGNSYGGSAGANGANISD